MKTTLTFTEEHIAELKKISVMDVFAAKIAQTILSKDVYRASVKQVDILNKVSDITFYISNDYSNDFFDSQFERNKKIYLNR